MSFATKFIVRQVSTTVNSIKNVTVVGAGLMGSGIAQVAAQTGHNVILVGSEKSIARSRESITKGFARVASQKFTSNHDSRKDYIEKSASRLSTSTDLVNSVSNCDLVIEAISEKLEAKQDLFKKLSDVAPEHAIFASNTSTLSISEIAGTSRRMDKFGGLHFFNPVPMTKLLEIIRIKETSTETYNKMVEFGNNMGKDCVTCKDTPGFIVNRFLLPYTNKAIRMFENGEASIKDIDKAITLGLGYPMGPFEMCDYIGLDTWLRIMQSWEERFPDKPSCQVPETIKKLVAEQKLGQKTGEGFYQYNISKSM